MFPPYGARIYYNELGEPLGWDTVDDGPFDPMYEDYDFDENDEDPEFEDEEDELVWCRKHKCHISKCDAAHS